MKTCLECNSEIKGDIWICKKCHWVPESSGDITLFAPDIIGAGESYDPAWYEELATLESGNFWFVARNRLIQWLAKQYCNMHGKYLEIGCGTGFVLQMLEKTFPDWEIYATEAQTDGIGFARKRATNKATFFQLDACAIPFRNEFDVIGAFDVIEHIRDDVKAINQIYAALNPAGYFVLCVPQHMFLWSRFDEVGCHFRRYSSGELVTKLQSAGFHIVVSTSFNTLLLPLLAISRFFKRRNYGMDLDVLDELRMSNIANYILSSVLYVEFLLVRLGIRWPVGGSRIVVAQKTAIT